MNYIVIATPTKAGKPTQYVAGTRGSGYLTENANDAARFVQATSAEAAIRNLRTGDMERRLNVTLSYGRVQTVVVETFQVAPPASQPGYIIKFTGKNDARKPYSSCPRKPKELSFHHAYYSRIENIDKATRYPTKEEAQARIDAMLEVLKATVKQMAELSAQHSSSYQTIVDAFEATVQKA